MTIYILDSDHISLQQRGNEPVVTRLLTVPASDIAITIINVEEIMRGRFAQLHRAKKPQERMRAYQWLSRSFEFLCKFAVLKYDTQAEAHFQNFRAQKIRVGTQDLRIAAIALSHNATLVTRNKRDFERISALRIEDWSIPE